MANSFYVTARNVSVREMSQKPMLILRLRKPSIADLERIGSLIGTPLPRLPNKARGDAVRAIWFGPDEWIIIGATATAAAVEVEARDAIASLCVRIGEGRCLFEVTGREAGDLLNKATSVDLHPDLFSANSIALTSFAQVNTVIDRNLDDGFTLIFDVSFQDYIRKWFTQAITEFG